MHTMVVSCGAAGRTSTIHLVDENGQRAHSAGSVEHALRWLWDRGEREVVAMTDEGPELFLIEDCTGLTMTLPAISMKRACYPTCGELPEVLGLGPDPTLRARILADRQETVTEKRARRAKWVRRATHPGGTPAANQNEKRALS